MSSIEAAEKGALRRLDEGFFNVRIDRLTPKEKEYVIAMARPGAGPYRSSNVAEVLGEKLTTLGTKARTNRRKGDDLQPRAR